MPISISHLGCLSSSAAALAYLKLDASNAPVTNDLRINGKVLFDDTDTYIVRDGASLKLYVNNVLLQEWTSALAPATGLEGVPMGLLAGITYPTSTG